MSRYNFKKIELKWQNYWESNQTFLIDNDTINQNSDRNYYVLEMFFYPSGRIHMGHIRNYSLGDVIARYKRAKGFNVLHPMGADAFGLPAENAAKEHGIHPKEWTYKNIEYMKAQLIKVGLSIDWSRELVTCSKDYYQYSQLIFINLFKNNLAYKQDTLVNWDPVDECVLANEQVIDGRGWRSGALVEQKQLNQWFLSITEFAQDLLDDMPLLKDWAPKVVSMQTNWISRSEGADIKLSINELDEQLTVFTSRPETIFGMSFIAISPQHKISQELANSNPKIQEFINEYNKYVSDTAYLEKNKIGINTGLTAKHPYSQTDVPIYIANFIMANYGHGAIFGCPGHDKRDFEFANKYNLPIIQIIEDTKETNLPYIQTKGTLINSDFLNSLDVLDARNQMISRLEKDNIGSASINYKLKDWGVSRQRYWGCPIPIVYCSKCGTVAEKVENLPITLPDDIDTSQSTNFLEAHPTWKYTKCPSCGGDAIRETDTLDTFFESSWYFLKYLTIQDQYPFNSKLINNWLPVDNYIGGVEHAILHLLYSRFFFKALKKINMIETDIKEPFKALFTQGMVCHKTFKDTEKGSWLYPEEVYFKDSKYFTTKDHKEVTVGRSEKMSKSKRNVVDPDYVTKVYGADAARLFILSDTPPEKDIEWTDRGIEATSKFINKLWNLHIEILENNNIKEYDEGSIDFNKLSNTSKEVFSFVHLTIYNVEQSIEQNTFNKSIANLRELFNTIEKNILNIDSNVLIFALKCLVQMFAPFIPHISEEIWENMGNKVSIINAPWPLYNKDFLLKNEVTIAVQILGKMRGTIIVTNSATQEDIVNSVYKDIKLGKYLENQSIKKVIYVPNKIINFII